MFVDKKVIVLLALFGVALAFVLWLVGFIPLWAIPLGAPAGVLAAGVLMLVLAAMWMAGGSH